MKSRGQKLILRAQTNTTCRFASRTRSRAPVLCSSLLIGLWNRSLQQHLGKTQEREMSTAAVAAAATAGYLARRAAQKQRVRILYRRALRDTLNWAVHRHIFYRDASDLRERFDANKNVEDLDAIDRMIADGEANYNKWRHPDPYIVPWAPGGSKFTRNPTPPEGIEIIYDYGREDND